ncbi:LysR family transcriptional regulator [Apilactobacillus ozensis]|uniref:LysR family transcriptional regulator n=1 Tax=Apilactobacillus ozensis TaxID=866801 RepID=UPI0034E1D5AB
MFITQPAVTQQVKSLEKELQLKLVEYHQPHLKITERGEKLASFVNNITNQQAEFINYLKKIRIYKRKLFSVLRNQ